MFVWFHLFYLVSELNICVCVVLVPTLSQLLYSERRTGSSIFLGSRQVLERHPAGGSLLHLHAHDACLIIILHSRAELAVGEREYYSALALLSCLSFATGFSVKKKKYIKKRILEVVGVEEKQTRQDDCSGLWRPFLYNKQIYTKRNMLSSANRFYLSSKGRKKERYSSPVDYSDEWQAPCSAGCKQ